jgi:hypothetical protein
MDWKAAIGAIAPTVATALGGPLAGLAVDAVGSAFGWTDATKEKVEEAFSKGQMTGEQILALKQAELALVQQEKELGFKFAELEFRDRDSARQRESNVKDSTNKILAYAVVGGFLAVVGGTLAGWAKVDSVLAGSLIGYLSAKAEQVLSYYFGSTSGSAEKSRLLAQAQPPK